MFSGNFLISFPFVSGATNYADEVHYVEPPAAYIAALDNSLQVRFREIEGVLMTALNATTFWPG